MPITTENITIMMHGVVDIRESGWNISTFKRLGGIVVVRGWVPGSVSMIEKSVRWKVSHWMPPVTEL
jgi:hypothetical protein